MKTEKERLTTRHQAFEEDTTKAKRPHQHERPRSEGTPAANPPNPQGKKYTLLIPVSLIGPVKNDSDSSMQS